MDKIKIYSYTKVWKVEKKIYSISNIPLPRPINPFDLLGFIGTALFMLIMGLIIPVTANIPAVIRFIGIPYGITNYLMKKKLDGKNPIKYFAGCIRYWITTKGNFIQAFRNHQEKKENVTLTWNCSRGLMQQ